MLETKQIELAKLHNKRSVRIRKILETEKYNFNVTNSFKSTRLGQLIFAKKSTLNKTI